MRRWWVVGVLAGLVLAGLLGVIAVSDEKPITPAQDAWLKAAQLGPYRPAQEDWDAIYQAAKQEGKVVLYSLSSRYPDMVEAFKRAYPGIEVEAYDMTGNDQVEKLTREQAAGIYEADVLFLSNEMTVQRELLPQHLLWNYVPDTLIGADLEHSVKTVDVIPEQFRYPLVHSLESKVVFYNTEAYPDGCPIETLWDLTLPEWKGRVQMKDPMLTEENMNFLQMIVEHSDEMAAAYKEEFGKDLVLSPGIGNAGYEWIKRLLDNGLVLTTSDGSAAKACGAPGQAKPPVTCSVASSKLRYNASKGTKLAIGWDIKPVVGITKANYLLIANMAPHPNAAKLLIRFMLGDSNGAGGFTPWNVPGGWSPRTDVTPKAGTLDMLHQHTWFLDVDWIYEHGTEVQDFWLSM